MIAKLGCGLMRVLYHRARFSMRSLSLVCPSRLLIDAIRFSEKNASPELPTIHHSLAAKLIGRIGEVYHTDHEPIKVNFIPAYV